MELLNLRKILMFKILTLCAFVLLCGKIFIKRTKVRKILIFQILTLCAFVLLCGKIFISNHKKTKVITKNIFSEKKKIINAL